jgi:hypothetical protein
MSNFTLLAARLRRLYQSSWGYPLFLFLVGFLAYLYPLLQLGYAWDDWEVIYLTRLATPQILEGYFFFDRPLAWPYPIYAALLGAQPALWHLLTFFLRWAGTLCFYQAFARLWPRNRSTLQWGGLLMLVYPAFLQQGIATAFSRHFTAFLLCGLSFYFTALALRTRRPKLFWILAWLTGAAQLFTIEYFAGLELARPVFIWLLLENSSVLGNLSVLEKLKRTTRLWLPFLGVFLAFGVWRMVYYPTLLTTQQFVSRASLLTDLRQTPLGALAGLLKAVWMDTAYLLGQTWLALLTDAERMDFRASSIWLGLAVAAVLAGLAVFFARREDEAEASAVWAPGFLARAGGFSGRRAPGLGHWKTGFGRRRVRQPLCAGFSAGCDPARPGADHHPGSGPLAGLVFCFFAADRDFYPDLHHQHVSPRNRQPAQLLLAVGLARPPDPARDGDSGRVCPLAGAARL